MSDRPALSRRVPPPAAPLSAVTALPIEKGQDGTPNNEQTPDLNELQARLRVLEAEKRAAESKISKATARASAAEEEAARLAASAATPPPAERSYAGTMSRPHRKADGLTYRRTTFTLSESMDKAIDYYVKSSGGRFRDRSAFLKAAAEAFFEANPLNETGTPVDAHMRLISE